MRLVPHGGILLLAVVLWQLAAAQDWNNDWKPDCTGNYCDPEPAEPTTPTTTKRTKPPKTTRPPKTIKPPKVTKTTTTTQKPVSHKLNCTAADLKKAACRNGGTCYVVKFGSTRLASCHCPAKYTGKRCEMIDSDVMFAGWEIVVGVSVAAIVLLIVGIVLYVYLKRSKRKCDCLNRKRKPQNNGKDSKAGEPFVGTKPEESPVEKGETSSV
ncbi:hypothetical protein Bpfe_027106 [Biomphalaria pfeifferi]|uniref:EGF-like domain-containing protein n=1 Tax=Biomphalaria pfeifferi TaxID=112525 RepID=A0AAD8AW40_BIOPF|nr:hypothetical protein Bpfe_027106 [Biomphalaria pfeifferi]